MRNSFMKIIVQYESFLNGHTLMLLLFTPRFHYAPNVRSQALFKSIRNIRFHHEDAFRIEWFCKFLNEFYIEKSKREMKI